MGALLQFPHNLSMLHMDDPLGSSSTATLPLSSWMGVSSPNREGSEDSPSWLDRGAPDERTL